MIRHPLISPFSQGEIVIHNGRFGRVMSLNNAGYHDWLALVAFHNGDFEKIDADLLARPAKPTLVRI